MAVEHGYGKIVTDGLVLCLDAADGNSFRGEPTTNVVTNTNLDTGWSKQYNTSIQWNDYPPPNGVDSQVVSFIDSDGNGSGFWYSYGDYTPQDPNTTYTVSVYARTVGSGWSIRAYTADNEETGRQYTNTLTVPGDGKWYRLEFNAITTPSDTQSDSLSFQFTNIPAGQRCWLCAPQMEAKSYATPFVNGTRGTTVATGGGWADLSGNTNHGELVNGPTYSSENGGSIVFDGVDDEGVLPLGLSGFTGLTVNVWYFSNINSSTALTRSTNFILHYRGAGFYVISNTGSVSGYLGWQTTVPFNQWVMLTGTWDGFTMKLYQNGIKQTNERSFTGTPATINTIFRLGYNFNSNQPRTNGKISNFHLYNRALTASEVLQNYNATKTRFGL